MPPTDQTDRADRTELVRRLALEAGFERVGIARAQPVKRSDYFHDWLNRGCAGEMHYLARHRQLRPDPRQLLNGARSIIVVAHNYRHDPSGEPDQDNAASPCGRIAQYAWGRDYHRVLRKKLHHVVNALHEAVREPFETRVCVDTAPIMEREMAAAAGIGWIGKNSMVLHQELGSFFFLGEIITTLDLVPSEPLTDRCGFCTRCLDACPTRALVAPYQMNASRCIAYLTIEHRSEVPEPLQPLMDNWVFGCDICQDVCPYNRNAPATKEQAYELPSRHPLLPRPPLDELANWTEEQYRQSLAGTAIKRASLNMIKRNAAIALRNAEPKLNRRNKRCDE